MISRRRITRAILLLAFTPLACATRAEAPDDSSGGPGETAPAVRASCAPKEIGAPGHGGLPADPYALAVDAYRAGDHQSASEILEQVVRRGKATAAHHALLGWCRLRGQATDLAADSFGAALSMEPRSAEALAGSGYVALRGGRADKAALAFRSAVESDPGNGDAWKGLGLALERQGDIRGARNALTHAVRLHPSDAEARERLAHLRAQAVVERAPRPAVANGSPPEIDVRARAARFEVRDGSGWKPLFVKGVNLGTALPGKFPAEFPDDEELYRKWFDQIGELGANVLRLYTLHPPSLYRALAAHNRERPEHKLWLMHGVWIELPPDDNYDDPEFLDAFQAEIRRVMHAVHGNLELPARAGHAHGIYDADLGDDVLAWLLGREWEPYSFSAYNEIRRGRDRYRGRYVTADDVQPIEAWLASICETAVAHETEYYGRQHPVGYTSWPTLDPLVHPTEATVAEEMEIRAALGKETERAILEYDNDLVNLDSTVLHSTEVFPAGLFAAYHAYPYYPDFMIHDPDYARVEDAQGVSRYLGYLRELKAHHGDQPVVIAEFGVPSSRGIAHLQPEGLHHGGHTTDEQGAVDARMLANIDQAGLAGGVVFAWMDEWFKKNWIVLDYESPAERNPLWLNVLDAEQNYGLLAAWPGDDGWRIVLDGKDEDWREIPPLYGPGENGADGILSAMHVTSDEAYVYIGLELNTSGGGVDWERYEFWIGIDTHDVALGDRRFPAPADRTSPIGLEFVLQLAGDRSRLWVDTPYDLFTQRYRRPYRSVANADGEFITPYVETNRERFGRDGTRFAARGYDQGLLRRGSTDPTAGDFDSLADWIDSKDGSLIEVRLPWGLLNVTDPSSRRVVHERDRRSGTVETLETEGFRFHVLALDRTASPSLVIDTLPREDTLGVEAYPVYRWPTWETPTYHLRLKRSYFVLQEALREIPRRAAD